MSLIKYRGLPDNGSGGPQEPKPELEAVLNHYGVIPKRRTGMTNCPLHVDHTPSLSISLDRGLWRCHSCGKGGDSYALIMEKEEIDFVGARALATTLGFAAGGPGGGGEQLSGSRYSGRRKVPARSGDRPAGSGYLPSWRRS